MGVLSATLDLGEFSVSPAASVLTDKRRHLPRRPRRQAGAGNTMQRQRRQRLRHRRAAQGRSPTVELLACRTARSLLATASIGFSGLPGGGGAGDRAARLAAPRCARSDPAAAAPADRRRDRDLRRHAPRREPPCRASGPGRPPLSPGRRRSGRSDHRGHRQRAQRAERAGQPLRRSRHRATRPARRRSSAPWRKRTSCSARSTTGSRTTSRSWRACCGSRARSGQTAECPRRDPRRPRTHRGHRAGPSAALRGGRRRGGRARRLPWPS